ncbi:MAG: hypothetical protein ACKO96_00840, partial [Flammeovirgaceae bacterium]
AGLQFCDYEGNVNLNQQCFQWAWIVRPLYTLTVFTVIFSFIFTVVMTYVTTKYFMEVSGGYT